MDRPIDASVRRSIKLRKLAVPLTVLLLAIIAFTILYFVLAARIDGGRLRFGSVERGDLRCAVSANGKVVPGYEEILVSPVSTRIREVYVHAGDSVHAGMPLLRLDLENAETEYQRSADEASMKQYDIRQASLGSKTALSNLRMQIEAKEMAVDRLYATYLNERRLDSIGSGTGERIREAELAWKTGRLELNQLREQLANEKEIQAAADARRRLEGDISNRNLSLARKTLEEARILAPVSGTVTWLNSTLGATVGAGDKVAIISDLTEFKIEGELSEGHADKLTVGGPVSIRIGGKDLEGRVISTNAQSTSGMIPFTVEISNQAGVRIRPGLAAQLGIIYDERPDVVRIPRIPSYSGPGNYEVFVREGDAIRKRTVRLGDSDANWLEVREGLGPGEEIVISDMTEYRGKHYRLK